MSEDADRDSPETARLLDAARAGDTEAAGELFAAQLPVLVRYFDLSCGRKIRLRESVSDLAQSVVREALGDLHTVRARNLAEFRGWLLARARNKVFRRAEDVSAQRRDPDREEAFEDVDDRLSLYAPVFTPSRHASAREELDRMERAFEQLDPADRDLIVQIRLLGRPVADLASELGQSETTVRKRLSRARARLALLLS